jgi:hypothetical protein
MDYREEHMKKLILCITLAAFAFAVQADSEKSCCDKDSSSCCAKAKASGQTKAECPMGKQATATSKNAGKASTKEVAAKRPLQSPKALALAN